MCEYYKGIANTFIFFAKNIRLYQENYKNLRLFFEVFLIFRNVSDRLAPRGHIHCPTVVATGGFDGADSQPDIFLANLLYTPPLFAPSQWPFGEGLEKIHFSAFRVAFCTIKIVPNTFFEGVG